MEGIKRLAIVGGGPKAAAIAAKAAVMKSLDLADVEITIFEPNEIGSNWSGKHGYTDGLQTLCTPAERDLGFPYSSPWEGVSARLHAEFSWASFKVDSSVNGYQSWVDRGRLRPLHSDFAVYLRWAVQRSKMDVQSAAVSRLTASGDQWLVHTQVADGRHVPAAAGRLFDGVVISGPGNARRVATQDGFPAALAKRVYDGFSFWNSSGSVKSQLDEADPAESIVVIGGGGTGAAVLAWLVRHGYGARPLILVADQATLFSRGDSVFENALFTDFAAWERLSPKNREHFFNRLNRGVVWQAVMDDLAAAESLILMDARAKKVVDNKGDLGVSISKWDGSSDTLPAAIVVDASGFDPWWFNGMLPSLPWGKRRRSHLQRDMSPSLAFSGQTWPHPPLHVPFLSGKLGPGFGSLMCLGAMSDAVLSDYVPPA